MASNKTKSASYRRNRDYSTYFKWNYELNCDVYNCYIRAREDPSIGYMKGLKKNIGMKFIQSLTFLQKSSYVSNLRLLKKKTVV